MEGSAHRYLVVHETHNYVPTQGGRVPLFLSFEDNSCRFSFLFPFWGFRKASSTCFVVVVLALCLSHEDEVVATC